MDLLDDIFDLLSEERRRYALYYLEQQDEPVSVEAVAERVAEWETDGAPVPEDKFENVEVNLLHKDLPKASQVGYVRYDPDAGTVEVTEAPLEFEAIVSVAEVIERPSRQE